MERHAAAAGILVSAGHHWHPAEPSAAYLRLSFAGAHPDWTDSCVAELAQIVRDEAAAR